MEYQYNVDGCLGVVCDEDDRVYTTGKRNSSTSTGTISMCLFKFDFSQRYKLQVHKDIEDMKDVY